MLLFIVFIFAVTVMSLPVLAAGPTTVITLSVFGTLMILFWIGAAWLVLGRLYRKVPPGQAMIRSGAGGMLVLQQGGAVVVPPLHDVTFVSIDPIRVEIRSEGRDALLTRDRLPMNVAADFVFHIAPDRRSILLAARSLGDRTLQPGALKAMLGERWMAALRKSALTFFESELTHRPEVLAEAAHHIAAPEMAREGLTLDEIEITHLSQANNPVRLVGSEPLTQKRA